MQDMEGLRGQSFWNETKFKQNIVFAHTCHISWQDGYILRTSETLVETICIMWLPSSLTGFKVCYGVVGFIAVLAANRYQICELRTGNTFIIIQGVECVSHSGVRGSKSHTAIHVSDVDRNSEY